MKAIWLFAVCFVAVGHCSAEIVLDDVELADTDSCFVDDPFGKTVRRMAISFVNVNATDGFEFRNAQLSGGVAIWDVKPGDFLSNETHDDFTAIPSYIFFHSTENLAIGESSYFGYGTISNWMQNDQEPGYQVFGWMHLERSADDGVLRVLESVGSYGPESTVEEGRYHPSPGIIVGTTQVPEPSALTLTVLTLVSIIACARRRARPLAVTVLVVASHQPCEAELVFTANLSEGRHSKAPGTYTDLTKTNDGYLIEVLTKEPLDTYFLTIDWESSGELWYAITVDQMLNDGVVQDPYPPFQLGYDPWGTFDENQLALPPFTLVTQQTPLAGSLLLQHRGTPPTPDGKSVIFEFSVEEIPPPNPADFNYDGVVDFTDFLRLSIYYQRYPVASYAMHWVGDADLDLDVDFEDFLILSENYSSGKVEAVPEPVAASMIFVALLGLIHWRKIQPSGIQPTSR